MTAVCCFNGFNSCFLVDCWVWLLFSGFYKCWSSNSCGVPFFFLPHFYEMLRMGIVWDLFRFFLMKKKIFALGETGIVVRYSKVVFGSMVPPFEEVKSMRKLLNVKQNLIFISSITINHVLLFKNFPVDNFHLFVLSFPWNFCFISVMIESSGTSSLSLCSFFMQRYLNFLWGTKWWSDWLIVIPKYLRLKV